MLVEVQVIINGSKAAVWALITNIENASEILSGVEKIEILDKPANGLVGLKWRETRKLFGKSADVEKWITDAVENEYYKTRAEDGGFVFLSTMSIAENGSSTVLTSIHDSRPQGLAAKLMSIPMTLFFKGVATKALRQDLNDIKAAVEGKSSIVV
jgi:carbon monoxide dehydrogenase subunit G